MAKEQRAPLLHQSPALSGAWGHQGTNPTPTRTPHFYRASLAKWGPPLSLETSLIASLSSSSYPPPARNLQYETQKQKGLRQGREGHFLQLGHSLSCCCWGGRAEWPDARIASHTPSISGLRKAGSEGEQLLWLCVKKFLSLL